MPELLGQTLLEGMNCGAPELATSVASLPDVVEDGVTGWLMPPNSVAALREKLVWLRRHPAKATAMGQAGQARVLERFTWDAVVHGCLTAYVA